MLTRVKVSERKERAQMGRPTRMMLSIMRDVRPKFEFRDAIVGKPIAPDEELEQRRHELKNGLTDMQRRFLLGKLEGLNDKDAALAAGYSLSVSENTKQRIWKPKVREEFARLTSIVRLSRVESSGLRSSALCLTQTAGQ